MDNPGMKRFSRIGLYLALVAVLVAGAAFILQQSVTLVVQISLGVAVIGLMLSVIFDPDSARRFLVGRQARYGSFALVLVLVSFGVAVALNYLAFKYDQRWDLTEDQSNTLAPETLEILFSLPEPVMARAFFSQRTDSSYAQKALQEYRVASNDRFNFEVVDPESATGVGLALDAGVEGDGEVVLYMGERKDLVTTISEQGISESLVRLMGGKTKKVVFLVGHEELSLDNPGENSLTQLRTRLGARNVTVDTLNLITAGGVPADTDVLVIAGPVKPLIASEVSAVSKFLDSGGSLVVMLEPSIFTAQPEQNDLLAEYLAQEWGVSLGNDLIIDLISQDSLGNGLIVGGETFANHIVTRDMENSLVLFPGARTVSIGAAGNGATSTLLVGTADQVWGETDLEGILSGQEPVQDDVDLAGPVWVAAASENYVTGSRVVVFGDTNFVDDTFLTANSNEALFISALDWAAGQENIIALTALDSTDRKFRSSVLQSSASLVFLLAVVVLPLATLGTGVFVHLNRKKKG